MASEANGLGILLIIAAAVGALVMGATMSYTYSENTSSPNDKIEKALKEENYRLKQEQRIILLQKENAQLRIDNKQGWTDLGVFKNGE